MTKPVMDYQNFLWRLLRALTDVRLSGDPHGVWVNDSAYGIAQDLIQRGVTEGYVSDPEFFRLHRLLKSAVLYSGDLRFPDARNAGPYMPTSVWFKRHNAEIGATVVKLGAQDSANDQSCAVSTASTTPQGLRLPELLRPQSAGQDVCVSPTPARRELRLLCLLVKPQLGASAPRYLPVHTLPRLPPRAMVQGRWSQRGYAGLVLRETQAVAPSAEVLVRCERHRQANAFRATARTVRTGGLSA